MNEYALGIPLAPMHSGYTETSGEVALSQDLLNMQICRHFLWHTCHIGWYTKLIGIVSQFTFKGNNRSLACSHQILLISVSL